MHKKIVVMILISVFLLLIILPVMNANAVPDVILSDKEIVSDNPGHTNSVAFTATVETPTITNIWFQIKASLNETGLRYSQCIENVEIKDSRRLTMTFVDPYDPRFDRLPSLEGDTIYMVDPYWFHNWSYNWVYGITTVYDSWEYALTGYLSELIPLDTSPPAITLLSPQNTTYTTSSPHLSSYVPLTFTINESISWVGYSLDNQANVTIPRYTNTSLIGLPYGTHSIIVYASDLWGNIGSSNVVYFTIALGNATTRRVPQDYSTIQAAMDDANVGDTILVSSGTYYEGVHVYKAVSIIGEDIDTTIIDGLNSYTVFYVRADNVEIRGFTIQNGPYGISFARSSNNTVSGNIIRNNIYGIQIYKSCDNNNITGNTVSSNSLYGIFIDCSSSNIFQNNNITGNKYNFAVRGGNLSHFIQYADTSNTVNGKLLYYWINKHDDQIPVDAGYVAIVNSTNIAVRSINLTNNGEGVLFVNTKNSTIENMSISNNDYGICIRNSSRILITGNTITLNNYYHSRGIFIWGSSDSNITCNVISNNRCGVYLHNSSNHIISNNTILSSNATYGWVAACGIYLSRSYRNRIIGNTITNNAQGIFCSGGAYRYQYENNVTLELPAANIISKNTITNNTKYGIHIDSSGGNTLRENNMRCNSYSFGVYGSCLPHFIQDIDTSNTVDGKPIYYLINQTNLLVEPSTFPDVGYLGLVNSINVTVRDLNVTKNGQGVLFAYTNSSSVENVNASANYYGIHLIGSSHNRISSNTIKGKCQLGGYSYCGIRVAYSSNNNILYDNSVSNHDNYGIRLLRSSGNIIVECIVTNNYCGICLDFSDNSVVNVNSITNNDIGIEVESSEGNTIFDNTVSDNLQYGLKLYCSNNDIYHNNFINNAEQIHPDAKFYENTWDDGYPSGGNYWSDYIGVDVKSGPNQDQPSSDGIGDTPYVIDADNIDHYPLMNPWGAPPLPSYTLTIQSSPAGVMFTVDGASRTTPWSGTYNKGASVSLVMPESHDGYVWSHWHEDGDTNRTKTVTMDTDITLTAVYTRPPPPAPVGGKAIPINKPIIKPELQIPWIWLSTIIPSLVVTVVYVKLKKKKQ